MLVARIASRAASACRSRAALTARHLSDAAAKQHERAAMEANLQFQEALADGTQPV